MAGAVDDAAVDGIVITTMRRRHLRGVLRIEAQQAHDGWSFGLFLAELGRPDGRTYLVARYGGAVVGFVGVLYALEDAHVTTIAVADDHKRSGIATRLLLAAVHIAIDHGSQNLTLEVRSTNEPALGLYRRFGLAPVGVRRGYYADVGEDAVVMWATGIDETGYADRLDGIEAGMGGAFVVDWPGHPTGRGASS